MTIQDGKAIGMATSSAKFSDDFAARLRLGGHSGCKPLNPLTVFMEPVNIRAENVARIQQNAASIGEKVNTEVFDSPFAWRRYAMTALSDMELAALKSGMDDRLHLWPDASLGTASATADIVKAFENCNQTAEGHRLWIEQRWNRISEWPGKT